MPEHIFELHCEFPEKNPLPAESSSADNIQEVCQTFVSNPETSECIYGSTFPEIIQSPSL